MKIELTKKAIQALIKLLHLGNWMANATGLMILLRSSMNWSSIYWPTERISVWKSILNTNEYIENSGLEED